MTILPTPYPTIPAFSTHPVSITLSDGRSVYPGVMTCPAWVFYGQQGEDLDVFVDFFRDYPVEKGVFVEVGAGNGVEFSNTHFFDKSLGWRGVLVEPNRNHEDFLRTVRSDCHVEMCAAGKENGEASFAVHPDKWAQSHRTDVNSIELQNALGRDTEMEMITVPVRPLGEILKEANISYVDFLSIDVEGSELEVLEGMDWEIPVHVLVIECTVAACDDTRKRVETCREMLKEKGFTFHKVLGGNEVWKNDLFPSQRESYLR
jgi:FkbM family methyltransferase